MNDNINDFLDSITQQELEQWEQIDLIDMEDKLAQKRIQKYSKKSVVAAVLVCILGITAMSTEAVQAALERVFHFIPNIGLVESDVAYDVEIICGKLEKENVTVELTDCYVKEHCLLGTIYITDTSPYDNDVETDEDITNQDNMMKEMYEKYSVILHHAQQQHTLYFSRSGYSISPNKRQVRKCMQVIIDKSDTDKNYEIEIAGFEQKLSFRLKEAKQISDLKQIGKTVTQNGSSITATAEMTEQGAKIDYYAICSEEANTVGQFGEQAEFRYVMPYFESIPNAIYECYLKTKSGDILSPIRKKPLKENGGEVIFDATKKDFPATFYYTSLSAKTDECYYFDLPVPEIGQTMPLDISVPFEYGIVKVLSVSRTKSMEQTGNMIQDPQTGNMIHEKIEMDTFTANVHIEPTQTQRILNYINVDAPLEYCRSKSIDVEEDDFFTQTFEIKLNSNKIDDKESIKIKLYNPIYWIVGEYAIPVKLK